MGTRSIIVIHGSGRHGGHTTMRLYKHWDGYPTGNLPIIAAAIKDINDAILDFDEFDQKRLAENGISVDHLAGKIIGHSTTQHGIGANFDDSDAVYHDPFTADHLGNQGDLEWIYLVDAKERTLSIYRVRHEGPQEAFERGTVDPTVYADQLKPEYKEPERREIKKLISKIEAMGFKVNPKPQRKKAKA